MAFSQMSSKEKTLVVVLGVVILIALFGIGILAARLITGDQKDKGALEITVMPTSEGGEVTAPGSGSTEGAAAITPVATPLLEGLEQLPAEPVGDQPVAIARQESVGPGAPVILTNQPLKAGRRYRLEITAADGSEVAIQGSWSQAATSASGKVAAPQIEFFEGTTPFQVDITAPVADPALWSCSVSAGPKDLLGQPPGLVITIWDVTGVK